MKIFILVKVRSIPLCVGIDFFCMATTGTLTEVQTLNPIQVPSVRIEKPIIIMLPLNIFEWP